MKQVSEVYYLNLKSGHKAHFSVKSFSFSKLKTSSFPDNLITV